MEIPKEIKNITEQLAKKKFEAYLVGGCVRDLILSEVEGRPIVPKDWDIATNARPEEIQKIFPDSVYENDFGTVAVKTGSQDQSLAIVEVTTYRKEGKYTDKRHPDEITFAKKIEDDLARRDFTINAIAIKIEHQGKPSAGSGNKLAPNPKLAPETKLVPELAPPFRSSSERRRVEGLPLVDPYAGIKDLKNKTIRTVGDPNERFAEDALRLMRAVRLAAELNFQIESQTAAAIKKNAGLLEMIAKERIRDEFTKMIISDRAGDGLRQLQALGLLHHIIPELEEGIDMTQNKHHIYTVFDHNVRALEYAAGKNYSLIVRLASLLHDVGKARTKRGEGLNATFYNHEVVGAKMTIKIIDRLRYSKKIVEQVTHLVRHHLFYYNVGEVSEAGVRRFLRKVGPENIADLIKVREADRIGSGVPKAVPYKLRHLLFMIDKVKQDPIHPKMLKIDGADVMKIGNLQPGLKVGQILSILLEEILDDPQKNDEAYLERRISELNKLPDKDLQKLAESAKKVKEEFESGLEKEIKKKHFVQ